MAAARNMSRRAFLIGSAATAAVAAGCSMSPPQPSPGATAPTPVAVTPSAGPSESAADATDLQHFMALSSLLTGFDVDDLDARLGRMYLDSLERHHEYAVDLTDLYHELGLGDPSLTPTAREARVARVLRKRHFRILADNVIGCWYTGIYNTADGPACNAPSYTLGWKSVRYTFPPGQCHGFGTWSTPPMSS